LEELWIFGAECLDEVENNLFHASLLLGVALLAFASSAQALDLSEKSPGADGRPAIRDADNDTFRELVDGFLGGEELRQFGVGHVHEGDVLPEGVQDVARGRDRGLGTAQGNRQTPHANDDEDQT